MSLRTLARHALPPTRPFSLAARRMAEGDAGAPRSGGAAQSDAFTKREQASEDYYVRQQEREKLEKLRKKIAGKWSDAAAALWASGGCCSAGGSRDVGTDGTGPSGPRARIGIAC